MGLLAALLALTGPSPAAGGTIRVLLLSGQSNHDWKATTPELAAILGEGGGFEVRVEERPGRLTARSLAPCDVVLSNWNAFGLDPGTSDWPRETRGAYFEFVHGGGGHVVVHAGSASFPGWEDYGRLTLATWKAGQTSHGSNHEFPVRMESPAHPVTAGLPGFTTTDELWNRPGLADGAEVLASGEGRHGAVGARGPRRPVRPRAEPDHPPRPRRARDAQPRLPGARPARGRVGGHGAGRNETMRRRA
jgi:hypothetical protein